MNLLVKISWTQHSALFSFYGHFELVINFKSLQICIPAFEWSMYIQAHNWMTNGQNNWLKIYGKHTENAEQVSWKSAPLVNSIILSYTLDYINLQSMVIFNNVLIQWQLLCLYFLPLSPHLQWVDYTHFLTTL